MPNLQQLAATGAEPVTLQEAKLWLRIENDDSDDDDLIVSLITAARQFAEDFCRQSFTPGEQWQLTLDHFPQALLREGDDIYDGLAVNELFETSSAWLLGRTPNHAIQIPEGPVTGIASVTYLETSGTQQTLSPGAWQLVPQGEQGALLYPVYGTGWPATVRQAGAVVVNFTAGATPRETIKIAIKQLAQHWYENRSAAEMVAMKDAPYTAKALLWPHRMLRF